MKLTEFGKALILQELETDIRTSLLVAMLEQTNPEVPMDHFVETEGMTLGEICADAGLTADDIKQLREATK